MNYKVCRAGDIVINRMSAYQGAYGIAPELGLVSPDYAVLRAGESIEPRWLVARMKTPEFIAEIGSRLRGIGSIEGSNVRTPRIAMSDLLDIRCEVPTVETQRSIADFLDRETAQIDAMIQAQQGLVDRLEERRLSLVGQAVFGHLLGQSLVETAAPWLPAIPATWPVTQLGYVSETLPGYAFPSDGFETEPGATPLLRGVNVKPGRIDWSETVFWDEDLAHVPAVYQLSHGDIVFGMDRPFIGSGVRVAPVTEQDLPALLLQRVLRIRPTDASDRDYLRYLFETPALLMYLEPMFTGISVPHVSEWQVRKFQVPLPPIEEQVQIARLLDDQTSRMGSTIKAANDAVALMQERRSALISAAVTGRIDPRTGSESIPEMVLESV